MQAEATNTNQAFEEKFEKASQLFKALAHPMRLKLVCGLLRQPCTQTHISRMLNIPQSSLAQHLQVLRRQGIVAGRREHGAEVILEVIDPRVPLLFEQICREGEDHLDFEWGNCADSALEID